MGVSGSGKSSVGHALADELSCAFYDADDFHPPENVAKMASGTPLNDTDREPWLRTLHDLIKQDLSAGKSLVLACSALKKTYRGLLRYGDNVTFVFLHGSFELILERMQARAGHFMKADLLTSQFKTLEPPANALYVSIDTTVPDICQRIIGTLGLSSLESSKE